MISFGSHSPTTTQGSVPRVVVEAMIHRGELASLEMREATVHGTVTAIAIGLSVALLLLAGFASTLALAAAVWQRDDRGLILGLVSIVYLLGAAALAWWAKKRISEWKPFSETARQFSKDCACVQEIISSATR
jgi:uncharacterized membrane protein YqjE